MRLLAPIKNTRKREYIDIPICHTIYDSKTKHIVRDCWIYIWSLSVCTLTLPEHAPGISNNEMVRFACWRPPDEASAVTVTKCNGHGILHLFVCSSPSSRQSRVRYIVGLVYMMRSRAVQGGKKAWLGYAVGRDGGRPVGGGRRRRVRRSWL